MSLQKPLYVQFSIDIYEQTCIHRTFLRGLGLLNANAMQQFRRAQAFLDDVTTQPRLIA